MEKEKLLLLWMLYMPLKGKENPFMDMLFKYFYLIILKNIIIALQLIKINILKNIDYEFKY